MSLKDINRKIKLIEENIDRRQRQLSLIEQSENIEEVIKTPLIKNEIQILQKEREKLNQEAERIKKHLEAKLPEVEYQYFKACEDQKKLLRKLYEVTSEFLEVISEVKNSIDTTHKIFMGYRNIAMELEETPKSIHLKGLYNMNAKVIEQIRTFHRWLRERVKEV